MFTSATEWALAAVLAICQTAGAGASARITPQYTSQITVVGLRNKK